MSNKPKHTTPSRQVQTPPSHPNRVRRQVKDPNQAYQARLARRQRQADPITFKPTPEPVTDSVTKDPTPGEKVAHRHPLLNVLVTAGTLSFIFLILYYAFRAGLLFAANRLDWEPAWWLINHPDVYEKTVWGLIGLYGLSLIIGIHQVLKNPAKKSPKVQPGSDPHAR